MKSVRLAFFCFRTLKKLWFVYWSVPV